MAEMVYDLCVIGAGMFGSAAARHASANPSVKVCLVGPAEPTPDEFQKREIFGAHYDEGRITRVLDEAPACQILSLHSISRYRELEKLSGINFYEPIGCLFSGPKNGGFIQSCLRSGAVHKVPLVEMAGNSETFRKRYPYLNLKDEEIALLDDSGGGHISPRNFVAAQKKVARLQGCHIIDSVVCGTETQSDGIHVVKTESKGTIKAKRLLIATGGFVNLKNMSVLKPLVVKRLKETVVLLNLPEDEAKRLSSMPSMISLRNTNRGHIGAYILPPIKYPDGQYYLKFGKSHTHEDNDELKTLEEVREWYLSDGDKEMEDTHVKFATELIPGLKFSGLKKHTCATCNTPSGLPYIDRVSPTVTVAVAGNGKGAKFSDEVGRIAAHLCLTGRWDSELSQGLFEAVFQ
ncbi:monomeric sarcosine oxidase-like [Argiope bruennichi]|uniref:monomeric sarcosine oxidase-like n=1 Tax=Argiope bruennichi TaxID=94029 RepID=UPI00249489B4|nr:monomeric sarcosine oxidase-like [Argiope bruennichi]XP_055948924.1 monomeric sarcosine oxidase-like [Argiope bruennichi]